ncbi:hypothetical protein V6N12_023512 [Hibiscus sabdariffa]|uniref:Uncharacterized protein n=1 Tax=Hibiscus sabdariffa TaxID=183260 RepID=A0ABR2FXW2_9ROSI
MVSTIESRSWAKFVDKANNPMGEPTMASLEDKVLSNLEKKKRDRAINKIKRAGKKCTKYSCFREKVGMTIISNEEEVVAELVRMDEMKS